MERRRPRRRSLFQPICLLASRMTHAGGRTRGYLPHYDERGLVQHIVFCLGDAIPSGARGLDNSSARIEWAERLLDSGHGSRSLADPHNAEIVQKCLLRDHGESYALAAWCVMPTHVHVVVEQFAGISLASVVQAWKSVTAHAINKREGRKGALWQREYFDRFMRSEAQFHSTLIYVENNPVAAGLVGRPSEWRFSSAAYVD